MEKLVADDDLMAEMDMITRGENGKICDAISAEDGWYLTGYDIKRGWIGGDYSQTRITVMEMLKGGGVKIKMDDGANVEVVKMDRLQLPEGGYIFVQASG